MSEIVRATECGEWNERMEWLNMSESRNCEWYMGWIHGFCPIVQSFKIRSTLRWMRRVVQRREPSEVTRSTGYRVREFVVTVAKIMDQYGQMSSVRYDTTCSLGMQP